MSEQRTGGDVDIGDGGDAASDVGVAGEGSDDDAGATAAVDDRAALLVPEWLDRTAAWAMRLIVIGILLGAILWIALQVRVALVPLLVAFLVAATLRPLARRLEDLGTPSSLAAAIPIVGVGAIVAGAGWFVVDRTRVTLEGDSLTQEQVRERIESWLSGEPFDLDEAQIADAEETLRSWLSSGVDSLGTQQATMVLQILGGVLLTIVLTFFLTKDGPSMWQAIVTRVDESRSATLDRSGQAVSTTVSAYLRSVIITGIADGLLIGLGLWVLGVPLVLPLMILTAIAGLFPVVGAVVAGAAAALVALVAVGPATAVWVVILTLVVQQIEGNVLQPLIVARQVSIHPVLVLVSLTAGGAVAGLAGAFLAVPIVAAAISAVRAFSAGLDSRTPPGVGAVVVSDRRSSEGTVRSRLDPARLRSFRRSGEA
ncbi:AI-2E family transporter [Ilumatobacter sp.]|uniref:AI-2E family transporter n=1 Tax=Ilumatobacter sp. TaxID=1967498 RepID=UPI003B528A91